MGSSVTGRFRGLFVGIDRYQSSAISWLSCAERDATALHALFEDNFGPGGTLLRGDEVTRERISGALEGLAFCAPEDFVVLAFSGHGSEMHQLVTFDADLADLPGSTIPLEALTELFAKIPARRLVCILDCCFSGGMGAKVLRVDAKPKVLASAGVLLDQLAGEGRVIITASGASEPAWESGQVGHGLLTHHLIEALTGAEEVIADGRIPVLELLGHVTRSVIDAARGLGEAQNPTVRGTIDGEFVWPVFGLGERFLAAFPEKVHPPATADLASLAAFGLPAPLLDAWAASIPGLNPLQLDAINQFGVLDGADLVVSAPTSSGKTMVGELAALRGVAEHRRALFLLPLKALVNDKHQEFERRYGSLGLRTIRATGEFNDDISALMQGHYDLCLMTYEKATALLLANPHLLAQVGTIVIDEAQMVVDPSRGMNLEFLLTLLKVRRTQGIAPQLIALSAVIGDTNGLERWLGARLLRRTDRPVPLREGVLTASGQFRHLDPSGEEVIEPRVSIGWGRGTSQDWLIPLVGRLASEGKKVIVFREQKGQTIGCATYLATALGLPAATEAINELPDGDRSVSSDSLRRVLGGGVAFHNADLDRDEKLVIEHHFRDPASPLRVIVATTTLAMGVNTPTSAVVIAGLEHPGPTPYSVAEYKNMVGRAGRLGFNEEGEAYLVPPNPPEAFAWDHYVLGRPEGLRSQVLTAGTDPRSLILRVLASAGAAGLSRDDIVAFLHESFGAYQEMTRNPSWRWDDGAVRGALDELAGHDLVTTTAEGVYHASELGRLAGEGGVEVESMVRLVAALRPLGPAQLDEAALVAVAQVTVELDALFFPVNRKATKKELPHWPAVIGRWVPYPLRAALRMRVTDRWTPTIRAKRAVACLMWMTARPRSDIEQTLQQFSRGRAVSGAIQATASRTCDLLPAVAGAAEVIHGVDLGATTANLLVCLEIGLPLELARLARAGGRALARGDYLALAAAGITSPEQVIDAPDKRLRQVLGGETRITALRRGAVQLIEEDAARSKAAEFIAEIDQQIKA
ncbi:MAG: DEAD/DEAH box helicase [Thermoleophilia bacterium]